MAARSTVTIAPELRGQLHAYASTHPRGLTAAARELRVSAATLARAAGGLPVLPAVAERLEAAMASTEVSP